MVGQWRRHHRGRGGRLPPQTQAWAAAAPPIFFWGGKPRPGASISDGMGASISDGGLQLKWDLYILRSLL